MIEGTHVLVNKGALGTCSFRALGFRIYGSGLSGFRVLGLQGVKSCSGCGVLVFAFWVKLKSSFRDGLEKYLCGSMLKYTDLTTWVNLESVGPDNLHLVLYLGSFK